MSAPLVSVLMTAYNREKYIAEAIESVLASSFEDYELIIVDDGSTDSTVEIARRYDSDKRVKISVNPKNLGDYYNRNHAASLASGKYLKYVDSDDIIYPHGLKTMVDAMERFPEAALGMMRPPEPDVIYPVQISSQEVYRAHFLGEGFLDHCPTAVILKTAVFREAGGFSGRRYVGDTEMWYILTAGYPVVKLMEGLVWWRSHGLQEFTLGHASQSYIKLNYVIAREALTSPRCPLDEKESQEALKLLKSRHARRLLRMMLERQTATVKEVMNETSFRWMDVIRNFRKRKFSRV